MSLDETLERLGVSARKREILERNHAYLMPNRVELWAGGGLRTPEVVAPPRMTWMWLSTNPGSTRRPSRSIFSVPSPTNRSARAPRRNVVPRSSYTALIHGASDGGRILGQTR